MGNEFKLLPIHKEINKESKKETVKFEDKKDLEYEIRQICSNYIYNQQLDQNFIIPENIFKHIIQLSSDEIFNIIFTIFGRINEKKEKIITSLDIKYLIYSFQSTNPKIKSIIFAYLIFQDKLSLPYSDLHKIIFKIFDKDPESQNYLISYSNKIIQNKEKSTKNKYINSDENYYLMDYIKDMKEDDEFFSKFNFIKKIKDASEYKIDLKKNVRLNYICDCAKKDFGKKDNKENDLDSMKRSFDNYTEKTNHVYYYNDFEKLLKEASTHQNIINLLIDYLKKYTQKDYCCFNDIKYIFENLSYSLSINDKKKFLFKMIQLICNKKEKISYNIIDRYLNIDYDENKKNENNNLYEENEFMNDIIFNDMINKFNPFLENFALIPYLYFKVKANDKKIKRRIIKDIIKNEKIDDFEKYLESKIAEYDFFYAIDINFWNILMNENEEAPDYINNSKIAEEINIIKEEDRLQEEITQIELSRIKKDKKEQYKNKEQEKEQNKIKEQEKDQNKERKGKNKEDDKNIKKKEENEKQKDEKNINVKPNDVEDNKNQKTNEENKDKSNTKDNENQNIQTIEIKTKQGKLKKGLKYKKDFIILCGQLYQVLKNNYKLDYIIRLTKIQTVINLNKNEKKEEKEGKKDEKKEEKVDKKEEKKDEKKEEKVDKKEEKKEEEKKERKNIEIEKKEEKNENKEKKEENKEGKEEETITDKLNKKNEVKVKEEEKDEEFLKNEKLVKNKLDKFIIDEEQGLISKLVKGQGENKYILNELAFYPIQIYQKGFGIMVRMIENAKIRLDQLEESKTFHLLSEKEQKKVINKKNKEKQELHDKTQKYLDLKEKFDIDLAEKKLTENDYEIKIQGLHDEFKGIFRKKEKDQNDYEVDITLEQFIDNLAKYRNNILVDRKSEITLYPRYIIFKDIKNSIVSRNPFLKEKQFDLYCFLFSQKKLFKPDDDYDFIKEGNDNEELINVIVDIYNDKGKNFYKLLSDKENEIKEEEKKKKEEKNKKPEKKVEQTKKITKKEEPKKHKLTEEEKKMLKEQERQDKIEKERQEKERKEREKEQKLREKKEREELEKLRKEQEKIEAQKEKERKQKEKEEQQRQKQLQKEREIELKKQKELEKFKHPPYGINNYGNTCYFNSVNQIFLNLPILQQIFLDPKIKCFINRKNKFGSQGKFFDIFRALYWIKLSNVGDNVINLKKMVGKLKEDFNNNRQQDANEYLNFLLENLHEDLNIHSSKRYIEEKDDIFHHNKDDELGNISWANNLKRNTSFIDSIFMFQLKSNLKCRKCQTKKFNFETNYIFDLPLSLCKMVTVDIYLYRLPFIYKLYYDKINKNFENYIKKDENKNLNIIQNLWNYYTNVLTIEEKKELGKTLHFSFDLEREKKMMDITKIIRQIKILEIEPEDIKVTFSNEKISEFKINHYTDFITYSKEKNKIIYPNSPIDKFVNIEDKIILNIYEVLNSNGISKVYEDKNEKNNANLFTFTIKKNITSFSVDNFREYLKDSQYSLESKDYINVNNTISKTLSDSETPKEEKNSEIKKENIKERLSDSKTPEEKNSDIKKENISKEINDSNTQKEEKNSKIENEKINIISLKENMTIFPKEIITHETKKTRRVTSEFCIPIFNYWRSNKNSTYLFRNFFHVRIKEFPEQYIILNNSYNLTAKQLYNYIWNLNILYMNHPNIDTSVFWWNQDDETLKDDENKDEKTKDNKNKEEKNNKEKRNIRKCYPFVLRYLEIPEKDNYFANHLIHCPLCPWYKFCPGCIIIPKNGLDLLTSKFGIVVDWCFSFVQEEFLTINFSLYKEIDSQIISENLPIIEKEENYQSIKDCFDLFFEEENLEDPLFCHKCQGPQDFSKSYSINRLPYVLILSLKRFKYNQNNHFKLRQMITYPLYNLELGEGEIKKIYDLFGVINHYGSISGGHYTSIIKNNKNEWILCNDSSVYKIEENRVMHSNAYILFYICKESPYKNDYIKFMKSIMNNIVIKEDKKESIINKDLNFFKNEPVITDYGEGYVEEENLVDFTVDENFNIYKELEQIDDLRIAKLNKKYEDKNKKETKEDKTKEKETKEEIIKEKEKDKKEEDKNDNKDNKGEKKEEKDKKEREKQNKTENKDENKMENKAKDKNEVKEKPLSEIDLENKKPENIDKKEDKISNDENKENKIIETGDNQILNTEDKNELNKDEDKKKKDEKTNSLPEYYKDFLKVKFDYGNGWIYKNNVKKYNSLFKDKDEKTKKK